MSNQEDKYQLDRRKFIKVSGMSTLALTLGATDLSGDLFGGSTAFAETNANAKLQFRSDGKFKIVQL